MLYHYWEQEVNIVVFSGGTGSAALVSGLKQIFPKTNISVIVNAYDDGKSTGICREITNTLGVSDIRKNHSRLYEKSASVVDNSIKEFYENRYDFPMGREREYAIEILEKLELRNLIPFVEVFFQQEKASDFEFIDFSLSNIVYSGAFLELGYDETIRFFEKSLLKIEDHVILNSNINTRLVGITESGLRLNEDEIVDYRTSKDKIQSVEYEHYVRHALVEAQINQEAISVIREADMIILSSGTFWSSLYPTLHYGNLGQYVDESEAKKIWILNNEEDGDSYGVSAVDFYRHLSEVVDIASFRIISNEDAVHSLQMKNPLTYSSSLGNTNGKHDPGKLSEFVAQVYFDLVDNSSIEFMLDFDDTLWSRKWEEDSDLYAISVENMLILKGLSSKVPVTIVSGNSFSSIQSKLLRVFGTEKNDLSIWADANSILYRNSNYISHIDRNIVNDIDMVEKYINSTLEIDRVERRGYLNIITTLSIKPIKGKLRKITTECLNLWFREEKLDLVAKETGYSTIDIVTKSNSKKDVITSGINFYYIGDEVDEGNDKEIASMSRYSLHVTSVYETNTFLKVLEKRYNT